MSSKRKDASPLNKLTNHLLRHAEQGRNALDPTVAASLAQGLSAQEANQNLVLQRAAQEAELLKLAAQRKVEADLRRIGSSKSYPILPMNPNMLPMDGSELILNCAGWHNPDLEIYPAAEPGSPIPNPESQPNCPSYTRPWPYSTNPILT